MHSGLAIFLSLVRRVSGESKQTLVTLYARIPSRSKQMNLNERITMDPEICHGKPTIRGLRYTVETILELLSSGMTTEEILADYEDLEREDILAALDFARRLSQIKRIEPVSA